MFTTAYLILLVYGTQFAHRIHILALVVHQLDIAFIPCLNPYENVML